VANVFHVWNIIKEVVMGGGGGYGFSLEDLSMLTKKAKDRISRSQEEVKRHVFISFAHEDIDEINLLRGQTRNEQTDLDFSDYSIKEPYDSKNAEYIKRQITDQINLCSVTLVYLSSESLKSKWVSWEINKSKELGKGVIGVYKESDKPTEIPIGIKNNLDSIVRWNHQEIMAAIEKTNNK